MMQNKISKNISLIIIAIAFIAFIYVVFKAIIIVDKTQIGTKKGTYTSYVTTSKEIKEKSKFITRKCESELCRVQLLLDYVSNIPYNTTFFQRKSPQKTIQENFGDCDDKSNLLISMLYALNIEAYFVLVPKHIFVIVPLKDERLTQTKGLWINGRKFYILESTAKESDVGFPLHYKLEEIEAIIEPFKNKKIEIDTIFYKV